MSKQAEVSRNPEVKNLIDKRIAYLLDSPFWETKIEMLSKTYLENNPSMDENEAYEFIIDGIIKQFKDPALDYLWHRYVNGLDSGNKTSRSPLKEKVA